MKDFVTQDNGAVLLTDEGRKTVLSAWQERKHPFLDEIVPLGLVPYLQALLLARHLRGDLDARIERVDVPRALPAAEHDQHLHVPEVGGRRLAVVGQHPLHDQHAAPAGVHGAPASAQL